MLALDTKAVYKVGIYCRLSQDDGNIGDSSSIQTQKMMLEKYCKDNDFKIVDFYVDDGFSGLNFNRPAFQRLLDDIEDKKINLVITKDLSRLGRDYVMTGYYMDMYFVDKQVRYIAVNDGVDTSKDNNDIAPFKNILNDMYARDLSKKVKGAKRQRALQGMFISSQVPFGYMKDPNDDNHLVIDEEACKTVKLMFKLALEGKGSVAIAKYLTSHRIIKPSVYKVMTGDTRFTHLVGDEFSKYKWSYVTVRQILEDMVYMGDMENMKYTVANYKSKKLVRNPKEKHIIVKDTHEPIISRIDFERVQNLIKARDYPARHNHENLFRSLLFCKTCGKRMALQISKFRNGSPKVYYKCTHHFTHREECLYNNTIMYNDIKKVVLSRLQSFFDTIKNDDTLYELLRQKNNNESNEIKDKQEIVKIEKRLSILDKLTKKVYEDYVSETINDKTYSKLVKEYQIEQIELEGKLSNLKEQQSKKEDILENYHRLKEMISKILNTNNLTNGMLFNFIDKIEVEPLDFALSEDRGREIKIVYRFINIDVDSIS